MVLISSCAINKAKQTPREQLEKELNKWQSFHMEGLAEINISSFVVRKYFICQKNSNFLQFDLVNSGLMGAEPAPLVSVKIDSLLTIDSPYQEMVQAMFNRMGLRHMNLKQYLDFNMMFKDKIPEIMNTGQTSIGNFEIKFDKNMQLKQIISKDHKQNITFQYRNGEPTQIIANITKLAKINLQVEQFVNTSCCDSLEKLP
jgi:hypothetical protein